MRTLRNQTNKQTSFQTLLKLSRHPPAGSGFCQGHLVLNIEAKEIFCIAKNTIFIGDCDKVLTTTEATKKRFYDNFVNLSKHGFTILTYKLQWRRNISFITSISKPVRETLVNMFSQLLLTSKPSSQFSSSTSRPFKQSSYSASKDFSQFSFSTSKPSTQFQISKGLREDFMHIFKTSLLYNDVSNLHLSR